MKSLLFTAVIVLVCVHAHAQLRKCTAPDGKVTYSDFVCDSSSATGSIKNPNGNTLDSSGFRQEVQRSQANGPTPVACKFSYYAIGDEKGKALAANAKEECLRNIDSKRDGTAPSLEHYNFWRDHRQLMVTIRNSRPTLNCVPNGFGGQRCN